ncbi:hypothetical protein C8R44DRAFT_886428 [Mycena epipterygia]|nr:hypothetical protein C8R44DRAFT_886428 [Mycena epipterygia]
MSRILLDSWSRAAAQSRSLVFVLDCGFLPLSLTVLAGGTRPVRMSPGLLKTPPLAPCPTSISSVSEVHIAVRVLAANLDLHHPLTLLLPTQFDHIKANKTLGRLGSVASANSHPEEVCVLQ